MLQFGIFNVAILEVFARPEIFLRVTPEIGPFGKFSDRLDIFWKIWKVSGQPGMFPDSMESFQIGWIFCGEND